MSQQPNPKRTAFELILIGLVLALFLWGYRNSQKVSVEDFNELKAKYHDTITHYTDEQGIEVARKESAALSYKQLKEIDSAEYAELHSRYKQLKSIVGSSKIYIQHDTVKLWFPSEVFDAPSIGLVEYKDSCLWAGFDFTDSGTYVNYLLASQSVTSTILREKGKIINDVSISSECGRIAQVKTFTFKDPKKKWHEKPLVVGGIGLGVGIIGGIIIAK